ncbi:MAG: SDR family NAD(P)-dependent oxidoreductase [Bacteroidetes bacterium]|nr:SDR family NAD(P)-dependent oxidoreductase [Bacteroidota bacterium]
MNKIWLVTGVSGGLGRSIAQAAANAGNTVYGTLRNTRQISDFENLVPGKTHAVLLDVNHQEDAERIVQDILQNHGDIHVLVNNAGYGLFGAIEEVTMDEARKQMETNFFAALNLCKLVIPNMRSRGNGNIVQISSIAGFRGTEGLGIYNASKFALEGFSQAMAKELAPHGIYVTLAEPGPFRTLWAGQSSIRSQKIMPEYAHTAGARIRAIHTYSGTQPGDPDKAAEVILRAISSENPPLHLPLGALAIEGFREKMKAIESDISNWEKLSRATEF